MQSPIRGILLFIASIAKTKTVAVALDDYLIKEEGSENMFSQLTEFLGKPKLYAPCSAPFWDDEHISRNMLQAHLDPSHDAASRRPVFIDR